MKHLPRFESAVGDAIRKEVAERHASLSGHAPYTPVTVSDRTIIRKRTHMPRWKFEVTENGQWVAGGDCSDRDRALSEASHYTMMYGQDGGDVKAIVWTGRKPRITQQLSVRSEDGK